ncbi:MAG: D-alanyl-D-alanine carboxypeptidase [Oscillospiraceae bacterium]|nr:D-alanyl-D-alanine carboxypeptidase [Oscillospiraceae bacterium]
MKKYKFFSLILIICALFSIFSLPAAAIDQPIVEARAAILVNADSGEVYYEMNADTPLPPASITKVMTALLALEAIERGDISLDDMVTASNTSHNDLTLDGSSQNIVPGETMSLEGLLYCMLVSSANEACNIIGEHVTGGSISAFIKLMNTRAAELGCTNTHFVNAHGLPAEEQYSTARDISLISAAALKYPLFVEIVNTVYKELPATNKADSRYLMNTNYLINPDRTQYYYSEARGIKTGSTQAAGQCLTSYIVKDDITVISVLLGCDLVELDGGGTEVKSFTQTKKLMQWFLNSYSMKTIISTKDLICEVPVDMAEGTDSVVARPAEDVAMLLPSDIDPTTFERSHIIYSQQEGSSPLVAPVNAGDKVGEISFVYNGQTYGPIPLVANTSVALSKLAHFKSEVSNTLDKTWVKWTIIGLIIVIVIYIALIIRYNAIRRRRRKAAHEAAKRKQASGSNPFK